MLKILVDFGVFVHLWRKKRPPIHQFTKLHQKVAQRTTMFIIIPYQPNFPYLPYSPTLNIEFVVDHSHKIIQSFPFLHPKIPFAFHDKRWFPYAQ
jgi:hypothetical protein